MPCSIWKCQENPPHGFMNGFLSTTVTRRFQPIWFPTLLGFFSGWKLHSSEPAGWGRAQLGDDHPDTLTSINNLGALLQAQGKLAEAEPLLRECLKKSPGAQSFRMAPGRPVHLDVLQVEYPLSKRENMVCGAVWREAKKLHARRFLNQCKSFQKYLFCTWLIFLGHHKRPQWTFFPEQCVHTMGFLR